MRSFVPNIRLVGGYFRKAYGCLSDSFFYVFNRDFDTWILIYSVRFESGFFDCGFESVVIPAIKDVAIERLNHEAPSRMRVRVKTNGRGKAIGK
jgi:hypothetical protein